MSGLDRIVDELFQAAMQDGHFDNLPGTGKPLRWNENPHEPEEWRMAFHLLRKNGFTLPWIALRAEIEKELEALRSSGLQHYAFEQRIAELNARILGYNLQVPAPAFQRLPLDADAEWKAAQFRSSSQPSE